MWTMKVNLARHYRGFKDTGIAFTSNTQLLLQNNHAGLDSASATQLHLAVWQGEGTLDSFLDFIPSGHGGR